VDLAVQEKASNCDPEKGKTEQPKLTRLEKLQLWVTLAAIIVGLALFVLFQYQSPSMKAQLNRFMKETDATKRRCS
jgi:cell division protein FtsL